MHNHPILQCSRNLDFKPRTPWPEALPAFAWRGELVCAFDRSTAIDLSHQPLEHILIACYPKLGLAELARLDELLAKYFRDYWDCHSVRQKCFAAYKLQFNQRLQETLAVILKTPLAFQTWIDEKSLGSRDLSPLLALPADSKVFAFLDGYRELTLSRSEGVLLLELICELHLMGNSLLELKKQDLESDLLWLKRLGQLRKPLATSQDLEMSQLFSQFPWPKQVEGEWKRFGDRTALEVRLKAHSPDELKQRLLALEKLTESWSCKVY